MRLCGVKHPRLKGVTCDMKKGHKEWHRAIVNDHWDELDVVRFWAKGRGKERATAIMAACPQGIVKL